MPTTIRALDPGDRPQWETLYAAYAEFYGVEQTDRMRARVWGWLMDAEHEVEGLVAQADGTLVGIAHLRPFARPLAAATGLFLDDLFVTPAHRGSGSAAALLDAAAEMARARGATVLRWITADDNARARALYDKTATATRWVTYDRTV